MNRRVADGSPACASFLPSALFDSTHPDGIRAWHLKRVCSLFSSTARTCKQIWDLKTYKIKNDLPGHTDEVYCVDFVADKLVSGGRDRTVKMCVIRALFLSHSLVISLMSGGRPLISVWRSSDFADGKTERKSGAGCISTEGEKACGLPAAGNPLSLGWRSDMADDGGRWGPVSVSEARQCGVEGT